MSDVYPLLFEPIVLEKVWGGRRLSALGKVLPKPGAKYGESWELADMGATSASGAGGGAVRSVIANGAMKGKTIHDAIAAWGDALIHRAALTADGRFPLLIKFLDASENLSVQVHPSPEYAASHAEAHLKTECWYIINAEPGALIYKGIKPGVSREEFSRLARSGDRGIVDAMVAMPAVVGECHNLPSGTVHALGAGVVVAEVQTPSDTTYRLYDWGRDGRQMHVEQALEATHFERERGYDRLARGLTVASLRSGEWRKTVVNTGFFIVEEMRLTGADAVALGASRGVGRCAAVIVLDGECELKAAGGAQESAGAFQPVALKRGATALVPSVNAGLAMLATKHAAHVLCAHVTE